MQAFTHTIGIDWSGAKGNRHAGLAVAVCDEDGHLSVIQPPMGQRHWSRCDLAASINQRFDLGAESRLLVGIDSAFSLPHADKGYFLPDLPAATATEVWPHIEAICPLDDDYYAGGFVDSYRDFVHLPFIGRGARYDRRLRVAERLCIESGMGPCESVYHLIGPSQVGMSAFSVMRMLSWLGGQDHIAVWPFQPIKEAPLVLVEIYAALFAKLGGHKGKVRSRTQLEAILTALGASFDGAVDDKNDHLMDALITAAGLRHLAGDAKYWKPAALSATVAETEGWIFGVG